MRKLRVPPSVPRYTPADASSTPDPLLAAVVADLTRRLGPICAQMDAGEFERLVLRIARWQRRWAVRDEWRRS